MIFSLDGKSKINKELKKIPHHIAIFMDGNGRWARKRGLPRMAGHREGANALKRIVEDCSNIGIRYITVYAFSTENWKRPKEEVDSIMQLLLEFLRKADQELAGKNVRIRVIGDISPLTDEIKSEISRVSKNTLNNDKIDLIIALNYGSKKEITDAAKSIAIEVANGRLKPDEIDENTITKYLYTSGIPDPDMVIRPSGELRLSNFLLWQSAYSEFWYSNILWPDFKRKNLIEALMEYQKRDRRFGGVK
jgi:undecaprenyl diphosphate synthase